MGVLGLIPFLRKKSPHVLKSIPSRFKELEGMSVVFDATLITQRFHYSPAPHEYRHVLGWYKLIQELHESNVRAICVFDGKERNAAKEREAMRRQMQRRLTNVRGEMEMERRLRLTQLTSLVNSYELLPREGRVEVAASLQNIDKDFSDNQHPADSMTSELGADKQGVHAPSYRWGGVDIPNVPDVPAQPAASEDSVDSTLDKVTSGLEALSITTESDLELPPTKAATDKPEFLARGRRKSGLGPPSPKVAMVDRTEEPLARDQTRVSSMLANLYSGFLASVRQMGVLLSPRTVLPRPEEQDDETKITQELSQAQRQLVTEEESIWRRLSEPKSEEEIGGDISFLVRELEDKSTRVLTSYERRNNPPTSEVYNQCKDILWAMGVPWIETKGGVEGEALAAAIVRHGLADCVASEDTDVLVYDVPLLRNVTGVAEPLTLIDAHEVRDALGMDSLQFLDFALLLGTDFTDRIRNVGPIRAAKFISCHGSIEGIIEGEPKYSPKIAISDYLEQVRIARAVFQSKLALPPPESLEVRQPNDELVLEVLQRFQLRRFADKDADFSSLLGANYFSDHP